MGGVGEVLHSNKNNGNKTINFSIHSIVGCLFEQIVLLCAKFGEVNIEHNREINVQQRKMPIGHLWQYRNEFPNFNASNIISWHFHLIAQCVNARSITKQRQTYNGHPTNSARDN